MESQVATAEEESAGGGLALEQQLCTSRGPATAGQMVSGKGFAAIGYDPAGRRFAQITVKLRAAGKKPLLRVHTDKGPFLVAAEQRLMLEDGELIAAAELEPGVRLRACTMRGGKGVLVEGEGDLFKFAGAGALELVAAECAVANWYPIPSVERLGAGDVAELEIEAAAGTAPGAAPLLWIVGPGGGVGIVLAAS